MEATQPAPLDEHAIDIDAAVEVVWPALLETVDGTFSRPGAGMYARVVGCEPPSTSGPRPLREGATVPGFRVMKADPGRELVLEGRHRFSAYRLHFRLEGVGARSSRVRAESQADFPGVAGGAYRLLVVGTGAHVLAVRRMLAALRRRAERA